mmetsp:Transcript_34026/g.61131  ORF Transcript_34026/g.61131 Transcript_34026/m.61131 type:complete len:228 (-) Transcript_34026:160-843(-)
MRAVPLLVELVPARLSSVSAKPSSSSLVAVPLLLSMAPSPRWSVGCSVGFSVGANVGGRLTVPSLSVLSTRLSSSTAVPSDSALVGGIESPGRWRLHNSEEDVHSYASLPLRIISAVSLSAVLPEPVPSPSPSPLPPSLGIPVGASVQFHPNGSGLSLLMHGSSFQIGSPASLYPTRTNWDLVMVPPSVNDMDMELRDSMSDVGVGVAVGLGITSLRRRRRIMVDIL